MNLVERLKGKLEDGIYLKIIGDSLTTGEGSSDSVETCEAVLSIERKTFYRREGKRGWAQQFRDYLMENYPKCTLINNGCGGINSKEIYDNFNKLYSKSDDAVILLMGANDRKYYGGMGSLENNLSIIIKRMTAEGKIVILMTNIPSTAENEAYENRLYHMKDVYEAIMKVARGNNIILIDNYKYMKEYMKENNVTIAELMTGKGCKSDGLHPTDKVHDLIFKNLIEGIGLK